MLIRDLKQGSEDWILWRRSHVCASEIPVLMGESDFDTPLGVWKIKTGRAKEKAQNFAMQRGSDTEPKVRALYSLENDIDVPPVVVEHPLHPFLGASLDGYSPDYGGLVVEIKYPGAEKHDQALRGEVPACYRGQIQAQLEASGAQWCDYVSYRDPAIAVVRVGRDENYIKQMIEVARYFYQEYMLKDIPPPLTDKDFLELDDKPSIELFEEWKRARLIQMQLEDIEGAPSGDVKAVEKRIEKIRDRIKLAMLHPKILCNGVKVITVKRKTGVSIDVRFAEA